jgi:hypothetical protein
MVIAGGTAQPESTVMRAARESQRMK